MKATKKNQDLFIKTYEICIRNIVKDLHEHKEEIFLRIQPFDFEPNTDFSDLAVQAFLVHIEAFHDHFHTLESIKKQIKNILNKTN